MYILVVVQCSNLKISKFEHAEPNFEFSDIRMKFENLEHVVQLNFFLNEHSSNPSFEISTLSMPEQNLNKKMLILNTE